MSLNVPEIGGYDFRVAQYLRRRTVSNTAAKVEYGDLIGNLLDQVHVVVDDKNGKPVSLETLQKLDELAFLTVFRPAPGSSRSSNWGLPARVRAISISR